MKNKIIKTSKGTFMIVDVTNYDGCIEMFCAINYKTHPIHLDGITEEQAKEVVDDCLCSHNYQGHPHYVCDKEGIPYTPSLINAIESINSLLEANGVVFEPCKTPILSASWQEAQSKVWIKENTYLFKKI